MTRIAVACTEDGRISRHFGRSTHFQIFCLEGRAVRAIVTARLAPVLTGVGVGAGARHGEGHGQRHGHARLVGPLEGCSVAMARGMGTGAADSLARANITPVVADGEYTPEEAVQAYLSGALRTKKPHACREHGRKHKNL